MVCAYQLYIHNYFYSESSIEDSVLLKEFLANNESSIENKNEILNITRQPRYINLSKKIFLQKVTYTSLMEYPKALLKTFINLTKF